MSTTVTLAPRQARPSADLPILKLSSDRKTAEISRWANAAKRWEPKIRNAFGLPAIESCPGSTEACRAVCYADGVPYPSARALLAHNYDALRDASTADMVTMLSRLVSDFLTEWHKVFGADAERRPIFRIHWSGDFFSGRYASAWAQVCHTFPHVDFWTYTRSFGFLRYLVNVPNLTVYVSADVDNRDRAETAAVKYGVPVAYMGDLERREGTRFGRLDCPETSGRIPLVSADGVGACASCRACIRGNRDIRFTIH